MDPDIYVFVKRLTAFRIAKAKKGRCHKMMEEIFEHYGKKKVPGTIQSP